MAMAARLVVLGLHFAVACLPAPIVPASRLMGATPLVTRTEVVHRFAAGDPSRYLTVLAAPPAFAAFEGERWLFAKNGTWPNAAQRSTLVVFVGCDALLRARDGTSCLEGGGVAVARGGRETHNYAVVFDARGLRGVSGLTSRGHPTTVPLGASDRSSALAVDGLAAPAAHPLPPVHARHAGCVEARPDRPTCEYDGRFSLAARGGGGALLLYARANTNPAGGGRHVSVSHLRDRGSAWAPFSPVRFLGGGDEPFDSLVEGRGRSVDIYFGSVKANPADPSTLLGLFPTVARGHRGEGAALLVAVSCDGSHFAKPTPVFNSSHVGGEIVDHFVDGFAVHGDDLVLYAHAGVPGTHEKACAYKRLFPKKKARPGRNATSKPPRPPPTGAWRPPPSTVVALFAKMGAVRALTDASVADLRAAGRCARPAAAGPASAARARERPSD